MSRFRALVDDAKSRIQEVSREEVKQKLDTREPFYLVDVREESNWSEGHIAGASHLNKGIIELKIEHEIPDAQAEIVLYCGGGSRAALAAESLQRMGYNNVKSLRGGFRGWKDAGYPTELRQGKSEEV